MTSRTPRMPRTPRAPRVPRIPRIPRMPRTPRDPIFRTYSDDDSDEGSCCCCSLILYSLFFFGVSTLIVGLVVNSIYTDGDEFLRNTFLTRPSLISYISAAVIVISILMCGCNGRCCIILYEICLVGLIILAMGGGIACHLKRDNINDTLSMTFNSEISQYYENFSKTASWDTIQSEFKCCGVSGPEDWQSLGDKFPQSCCENNVKDCSAQFAYEVGCIYPYSDIMYKKYTFMKEVFLSITGIQVFFVAVLMFLFLA